MRNEDRHPFSKGAGPFNVQLPETLLLSSSGENSSSCSSASFSGESDDGEVLGDNSDITATANTPATPAMHPPIKLNIFPILSSLGIISSVIEGLLHDFEYGDGDRYGWSPTHMVFPPSQYSRWRFCRAWSKRIILSGGPKMGSLKHLEFITPPFSMVETKRGTIGPPRDCWFSGKQVSASESRSQAVQTWQAPSQPWNSRRRCGRIVAY